jgi:hypothetical protein
LYEDSVRLRLQGGDAGAQAFAAVAYGGTRGERVRVDMVEVHDLPQSRR